MASKQENDFAPNSTQALTALADRASAIGQAFTRMAAAMISGDLGLARFHRAEAISAIDDTSAALAKLRTAFVTDTDEFVGKGTQ